MVQRGLGALFLRATLCVWCCACDWVVLGAVRTELAAESYPIPLDSLGGALAESLSGVAALFPSCPFIFSTTAF